MEREKNIVAVKILGAIVLLAGLLFGVWQTRRILKRYWIPLFLLICVVSSMYVNPVIIGLIFTAIILWWWFSLIDIASGEITDLKNLGGGYMGSVTDRIPGLFINSPHSINHDARYDDWDLIPLRDEIRKGRDDEPYRVYAWGYPGYEKVENSKSDNEFKDDRPWFERKTGKHFGGFYPFCRIMKQKVIKRKTVPAGSITKKITGNANDPDNYPEYNLAWTDFQKENALIEMIIYVKSRRIITREIVIIRSAETGFKASVIKGVHDADKTEVHAETNSKKGYVDELVRIDIPIVHQVQVTNPFRLATRTTELQGPIDSVTKAKGKDYVAANTIDSIQADPQSTEESNYRKSMMSMNGDWKENGDDYFLTDGLRKEFGCMIVASYFTGWSPADAQSEKMINTKQQVYISENDKLVATNNGIAAGSEYEEEIKRKGDADANYLKKTGKALADNRKLMVEAGPEPTIKAFADGIKRDNGAVVLDGTTVTKILNMDEMSTPKPQPTPKKDEKVTEKPKSSPKKEGGTNEKH